MTRRENPVSVTSWARPVGVTLIIGVVTYLISRASLEYFKVPGAASAMWWPAAGLALVIVVRCPRSWWFALLPAFGIATGFANIPLGGWAVTLTYAGVNMIEVTVAALILQESSDPASRRLRTAQEAIRFIIAIGAAVVVGSSLVALRSILFPGDAPWHQISLGYGSNHALGLLALAPLLLPGPAHWRTSLLRNLEFGVVIALTAVLGWWVFLEPSAAGRAFPVLLPVIWAATRLDPVRATITSLVICVFATYGTSRSLGTFVGVPDLVERQLVTQFLIGTVAVTTLALVLITRHRARLVAQASDSEHTLAIAIQEALVGIYSIRLEPGRLGEIRDVNAAMCLMLDYQPEQLIGRHSGMFFPSPENHDEIEAVRARTTQMADGAIDVFQRETRLVTAAGVELWVELSATRVTPTTAPPFALVYVHDLTGREQNKKLLETMALHDALTGLPNRAVIFPRLDELLRRADREGGHVGLLYLDLNGFKPVNDTYGHAAGDTVLVEVARRIERAVRPGDTAARLGGDEFAVLAADIKGEPDMTIIADRIHASLTEPIVLPDGSEVTIGTSIGTAVGDGDTTADELLRRADVAMYQAKSATHAETARTVQ